MKKNFIIVILVMILVGLVTPKVISSSSKILNGNKNNTIGSNVIQSEYKEGFNEIKNNEFLPENIKKLLDKIFFFI